MEFYLLIIDIHVPIWMKLYRSPSISDIPWESAAIIAIRIQSCEISDIIGSVLRFVNPIFGANVASVCVQSRVFVMMFANCSVVVTLSRARRPCRSQGYNATCFNRPSPNRVAMAMHTDAFSLNQAVPEILPRSANRNDVSWSTSRFSHSLRTNGVLVGLHPSMVSIADHPHAPPQ